MGERQGSQTRRQHPATDLRVPLQRVSCGKMAQERETPQQRQSLGPEFGRVQAVVSPRPGQLQFAWGPLSEAGLALGLQSPMAVAEEEEATLRPVHPPQ